MDEQEIRERVEKRIKERNDFYIHLVVYIVAVAMMWAFWAFIGGDGGFAWPLIAMVGWGIGIVAHGLTIFFKSPERVAARERMIQREIERERERLEQAGYPMSDKRKRDALYRLSDDGELIEVMDDEIEIKQKREG
jgi:hypothetical protein